MKRKFKLIFLLPIFLILSFVLTGFTSSVKEKLLIPDVLKDVYVYDQGNFIDDEVEKEINNLLVQLEDKTTVEFAVITVPNLNELSIETYAVNLANELGIGKAETDNGILLLASKTDNRVRLEIGSGMQGVLTDSISGRTLDNFFVPYRAEGNYDDACLNTVQAIINFLAQTDEYEFSIEGLNPEVALADEEVNSVFVVLLCIVFLVFMLFIFITTLSNSSYDFSDNDWGSSSSSSSWGSSSSSSSSSFGGGDFNGGGASR